MGNAMESIPRVSIGLPVYNGQRFLPLSLESLLGQTFRDFELIICDNASTDGTQAICERLAARDARVRYHRNAENIGAAANYNHAFELSRGEYFKWATHDDLCGERLLERCVATLDADPGVVLAFGRTMLIDEAGRPIRPDRGGLDLRDETPTRRVVRFMRNVNLCNPVLGLVRADVLRQTRLIDTFIGSDAVLLVELALRGRFHEVPEVLFFRRIHEDHSRRKNPTPQALAAWFNPKGGSSLLAGWVQTRLMCEKWKAVWRAPLPLGQRVRCSAAMTGAWYWRRLRVRAGALRRALSDAAGWSGRLKNAGAAGPSHITAGSTGKQEV